MFNIAKSENIVLILTSHTRLMNLFRNYCDAHTKDLSDERWTIIEIEIITYILFRIYLCKKTNTFAMNNVYVFILCKADLKLQTHPRK